MKDIAYGLLEPGSLPELWSCETVDVQTVVSYFKGGNVVQLQRNGYTEPMAIPNASDDVVKAAITQAVEQGSLWLICGPASVLAEPIPAGVLTDQAILQRPPAIIAAAEILPENLPDAWNDDETTALAVATALSQNRDKHFLGKLFGM